METKGQSLQIKPLMEIKWRCIHHTQLGAKLRYSNAHTLHKAGSP